MLPRRALKTVALTVVLALVALVSARLSGGQYERRVVPVAVALITAGIAVGIALAAKGKKADQECDERENLIELLSMRWTFYVMAFALTSAWAYEVAREGTLRLITTGLFCAFWGSSLLASLFIRTRH